MLMGVMRIDFLLGETFPSSGSEIYAIQRKGKESTCRKERLERMLRFAGCHHVFRASGATAPWAMVLPMRFAASSSTGQRPSWLPELLKCYSDDQARVAKITFADRIAEITNPEHHDIISDLLNSGEWQEASKAALLAHYCKDQPADVFKGVLETTFTGVAAVLINQSTKGIFNLNKQAVSDEVALAVQKGKRSASDVLYQDFRTNVEGILHVKGNLWVMTKVGKDSVFTRNVKCTEYVAVPDEAKLFQFQGDAVELLGGESGSGKTWHVLSSLPPFSPHLPVVGLYMISHELEQAASEANLPADTGKRNEAAVKAVLNCAKSMFPEAKARLLADVHRVVIAIDECGSHPKLIRALCSARQDMKAAINAWIKKNSEGPAIDVRIILVGAGVDSGNAAVGTTPESYRIVRMPPCTNFFDVVWPAAARSAVQNAVVANPRAKNMQGNRRLAALIVNTVSDLTGLLHSMPAESVHLLVPAVLHSAMLSFKEKNSFATHDPPSINRLFLSALRLAMNVPLHVDDKDERELCGTLGVLTDEAQWQPEAVAVSEKKCVLRNEGGYNLVCTKGKPRYRVTAAHMELFAARFGLGPIPPSWTGFELAVGYFVALALHACNGGSKQDLVDVFGEDRFKFGKVTAPGVPKEELTYSGVTLVQLKAKLESGDSVGKLTWYDQKTAAVMLNGPAAAFADVMGLVPGLGLLLVQCKCYGAGTPFGEYEALAELFKMGLNEPATAIAHFAENVGWGYLQSDPFTQDASVPEELKNLLTNVLQNKPSSGRTVMVPRNGIFVALTKCQAQSGLGKSKVAVACVEAFGRKYAAARAAAVETLLSKTKKTTGGQRVVRILATTTNHIAVLDDKPDVIQLKVSPTSLYPVPVPDQWQPPASAVDVLVKLDKPPSSV